MLSRKALQLFGLSWSRYKGFQASAVATSHYPYPSPLTLTLSHSKSQRMNSTHADSKDFSALPDTNSGQQTQVLEKGIGKQHGEQYYKLLLEPDQPPDAKMLRVAVIGLPNSGKSTLTNSLLGWRVSSVSKKVHTTRKNTTGILTEGDTQIVFLDTPGVLSPSDRKRHNLERTLLIDPERSLNSADLVCVLVDVSNRWTRNQLTPLILEVLHLHQDKNAVLIMNKVDQLRSKELLLQMARTLTCGIVDDQPMGMFTKKTKERPPDLNALFDAMDSKKAKLQRKSLSESLPDERTLTSTSLSVLPSDAQDVSSAPSLSSLSSVEGSLTSLSSSSSSSLLSSSDAQETSSPPSSSSFPAEGTLSPSSVSSSVSSSSISSVSSSSSSSLLSQSNTLDASSPTSSSSLSSSDKQDASSTLSSSSSMPLPDTQDLSSTISSSSLEETRREEETFSSSPVTSSSTPPPTSSTPSSSTSKEDEEEAWASYFKKMKAAGKAVQGMKGWPHFKRVFFVSALTGDGVADLRNYMIESAKPGDWEYHSSLVTSQDPQELVLMCVKEKLMEHLKQEMPYSMHLDIVLWEVDEDGLFNIIINIVARNRRQLSFLLGPRGQTIQRIASEAKQEMMNAFRCEMRLKLVAKVDQRKHQ